MFGMLFRRVHATVDRAVDDLVNRAVVAIPFLIAGGFVTAAVTIRLNQEFGLEAGLLIVASAFALLGLIVAVSVRNRSGGTAEETGAANDEVTAQEPKSAVTNTAEDLSKVDRELLMAAFTSAAPIAIPALVRTVGRNLPLIAAVAAAAFIIARDEGNSAKLEPGE
jgi:hypothetical protein